MSVPLRWVWLMWVLALTASCAGQKQSAGMLTPDSLTLEQTYQRGKIAYETGKFTEAAEHFARVVAVDPHHLRARINWGAALSRDGKPLEAISKFQQALVYDPLNAEAYYNWGAALARLGQHPEALEKFDQALTLKTATALLPPSLQASLQDYMRRHRPPAQDAGLDPKPSLPAMPR